MASVNIKIKRHDMEKIVVTTTTAALVTVPLRVLIPLKVGMALIRLGARIAGVTHKEA